MVPKHHTIMLTENHYNLLNIRKLEKRKKEEEKEKKKRATLKKKPFTPGFYKAWWKKYACSFLHLITSTEKSAKYFAL